MPILPDPAYRQTAIAGPVTQSVLEPAAPPPQDQSALDVLSAAARGNVGGALYDRVTTPDPDMPAAPPGWDAGEHLQGFEGHAKDLIWAQTPSQLEGMKLRIQRGEQDADVLRKTGFWGKTGEMAFAGSDPSFLVSIAVPEVRIARSVLAAKTATAVAHGAVAGAAYEAEMQSLKDGRSATESLYGVGSVALMSGVLGHLLAHVPPSKMKPIHDAIEAEAQLARSEAGAAAVARPTTLAEESLARGGANLSRAFSKTTLIGTDLDRIMASGNVSAHTAVQELADVPQMLGKNEAGIATPRSVEAAVSKHDARLADFIDHAAEQWVAYAKRVPKEERLSKREFYENIAKASRRNDSIGIPEVDSAARFLRQNIFDPLKDRALKLKLFENQQEGVPLTSHAEGAPTSDHPVFGAEAGSLSGTQSIVLKDATGKEAGRLVYRDRGAKRSADSVKSDAVDQVGGYDVAEGALTDEQLAQFEGLRAGLPAQQELAGSGERVSGEQGRANDGGQGTTSPLEAFRGAEHGSAEGVNAEDPASGLGTFFTSHADAASSSGSIVEKNHLDIRNPKTIRFEDLPAFESVEQAAAYREQLQAEGFDGLVIDARHLGGPVEFVAFKHEQVIPARAAPANVLQILRAEVGKDFRGAGHGQRLVDEAIRAAEKAGKPLVSDSKVSLDQLRVYEALKKKGYTIEYADEAAVKKALADGADVSGAGPVVTRIERPPGLKLETGPKLAPVGAGSYFRRMYDRDAIRSNLSQWQSVLYNHFAKSGDAIPAEIHAAVDDVTKTILHSDVGQSNFATKVSVPAAGPLKERTLDIPDELIEKFLINDPQRVAQAYVRDLAPQVEMATRFGDVDMKGKLGEISDEFAIKREALRKQIEDAGPNKPAETVKLNKQLEKLLVEEKDTLEAVVRVRDRVLGRAGRLSPDASEGTRRAVKASRGWRNLVASARLGGTAITGGLMDTAKIAAQYGFLPTIKKLTQLVKSKAFRELSTAQARRVGSAVEAALSKRVQVAYDGAVTEGWTQTLANSVYKYTGLNHATDFNRTLAATLFEDSVLKAVGKMAEGKTLPAFERARLASLGLGDKELAGVAEQIAKHGGEADGIRVSGSADWDNKALADAYDSAVLKESKIAVQQPGAADRVWWMDKETGKLIGQLKTFSLSSNARLLSGGLQMAGHGQYGKAARFFGYMMMGGYLTHVLRQGIAGKTPTTDPKTASFEAFTESGLGGVIPDLLSPVGRRLGVLGESVRFSDRNALSAYGGPALGAANDLYDFTFNRTQGGLSAKDLHMMRRLAPWNQVWWLRREINAVEGEVAEGFDLQGSDQASFGERMLRTDVLPDKRDGAGIPVQ